MRVVPDSLPVTRRQAVSPSSGFAGVGLSPLAGEPAPSRIDEDKWLISQRFQSIFRDLGRARHAARRAERVGVG
jgi:hypothetical protein